MRQASPQLNKNNVVHLFTRRTMVPSKPQIVRIAAELDSMEMLYSNQTSSNIYSLKIVCWGLRDDGKVVGMVPWLGNIVACPEINDPLNGRWEGYRDPGVNEIFFEAPIHKMVELETAAKYYQYQIEDPSDIIQEIPDVIGTHAVLTEDGFRSFILAEVVSWRLQANGQCQGMIINENQPVETPVLLGANCLVPAQKQKHFRYFFQHKIANKIKNQDPEALAAIALLVEPTDTESSDPESKRSSVFSFDATESQQDFH